MVVIFQRYVLLKLILGPAAADGSAAQDVNATAEDDAKVAWAAFLMNFRRVLGAEDGSDFILERYQICPIRE